MRRNFWRVYIHVMAGALIGGGLLLYADNPDAEQFGARAVLVGVAMAAGLWYARRRAARRASPGETPGELP